MEIIFENRKSNSRELNPELTKKIPGTCSELPIGGNLITDLEFPVKQGTEVFVNCAEGYTLTSGDRTITCVQDANYISQRHLPTCIIGTESID